MVDAITPTETHDTTRTGYLEDLVATALLGIAALACAYGGWQAALWGGVQNRSYNQANLTSAEANRLSSLAAAEMNYDAATSVQLAIAREDHPAVVKALMDHVIRREFKPYVEQWLATEPLKNPDAPSTPFAVPAYHNEHDDQAKRLMTTSLNLFQRGTYANRQSDAFTLATVTASFVLFFAGLAPKLRRRPLRMFVLGLAIVAFALAFAQLALLPRA